MNASCDFCGRKPEYDIKSKTGSPKDRNAISYAELHNGRKGYCCKFCFEKKRRK
jgi:hypothetical protein